MNKCKSCIYLQELHEYDTSVVCEKRGNTNVCSKCIDYASKRQIEKLAKLKKKLDKPKAKAESEENK